jgi:hypothetical protein
VLALREMLLEEAPEAVEMVYRTIQPQSGMDLAPG